jgi:lysophospholipase L1-like esterase
MIGKIIKSITVGTFIMISFTAINVKADVNDDKNTNKIGLQELINLEQKINQEKIDIDKANQEKASEAAIALQKMNEQKIKRQKDIEQETAMQNEYIKQVENQINSLKNKKDLYTYDQLTTNLIPKIKDEEVRKEYFDETIKLAQEFVFTNNLKIALDALNKASNDLSYIKEAEKKITNGLAYENPWSMSYLQDQLNYLKSLNTNKKQVLIIGDSITLGMGSYYDENNNPVCNVDKTWWNDLDKDDYEFSIIAVGGMGVVREGKINNIVSGCGIDMLKFAEKTTNFNKKYDKVIIALSCNDDVIESQGYKNYLKEIVDYMKQNYKVEEYMFVNFYSHKEDMKEIADIYKSKYIDIDMSKINKFNPTLDDTHPSIKGQSEIEKLLEIYF